jgi:SAM-dependent methyltransferase
MKYSSQYSDIYFSHGVGEMYDSKISNRFESFIFSIEKRIVEAILTPVEGINKSYLDFACGTGRILSFVAGNFTFKEYVGFDSSKEMIEVAKSKVPRSNTCLIVGNILEEPEILDNGKFDVVTAFRLILNLEPEYRLPLLKQLNAKIKKGGILIINNHMNRYSMLGLVALFMHKVLGYPLKRDLNAHKKDRRSIINTMSEREARVLLEKANFRVVRTYRFTFFPGHNKYLLLPPKLLYPVELFLSKIPLINFLCKDQVYVCLKK